MRKLPQCLYKYRAFNVNTLRMLTKAEVYYANPEAFNDPLDSKPSIQVDTDLQSLENLLRRMLVQARGQNVADRIINEHRYMSTRASKGAEYFTQSLANEVLMLLRKDFGAQGVLSLAERWDCPLMWSHYADEHRGVCIEYDMSDHVFEGLEPVDYRKPRSIRVSDLVDWKINRSDSAEQEILRTFYFAKAPQWRYEREWRDIRSCSGADSAPARVSAIYFGLRCDPSVATTTVKLHARSEHRVKFYKVDVAENSFRLKRFAVDVDEIEACGLRTSASLDFRDGFEVG